MNVLKILILSLWVLPLSVVAQKAKKSSPVVGIAYVEQTKLLAALPNFGRHNQEIDSLRQVYTNEVQASTKHWSKKHKRS